LRKLITAFFLASLLVLVAVPFCYAEAPEGAVKEIPIGKGLALIGAGLAIGLGAVGTGLAQGRIGAAGVGSVTEKPELLPTVLILLVIPETMVILGFVIAILAMR
jgi:V/A-type H+-transporting ATPase subunit K